MRNALGGFHLHRPIRYFAVNEKTEIMHISGLCRQTKKRDIPIRLFDTPEELCTYAGRPLRLCRACLLKLREMK